MNNEDIIKRLDWAKDGIELAISSNPVDIDLLNSTIKSINYTIELINKEIE